MSRDLPPEAITAAARALHQAPRGLPECGGCGPWDQKCVCVVLEAAAPHLAAAERERCAELAEQHGVTYWNPDGSTQRLSFADLLRRGTFVRKDGGQ